LKNAQFHEQEVPILKYDPEIFLKTAKFLYRRLKMNKVRQYKMLKSQGFNVKWMVYETFVKEGRAALLESLKALGVDFPDHEGCEPVSNIRWAHPKETKYYMLNYEECMAKFKEEHFESFEELLNV
jgi:hypothetical protein